MRQIDPKTHQLLIEAVSAWQAELKVSAIAAITPDASTRRYYRIHLAEPLEDRSLSIVAMVFDAKTPAEAGCPGQPTSDLSYIELTDFLSCHNIPVPKLYFHYAQSDLLLIEDCGVQSLAELALNVDSSTYDEQGVLSFFSQAANLILRIQSVAPDTRCVAFRRRFSEALFRSEMQEFSDYVLSSIKLTPSERQAVDSALAELAYEIAGFPQVLCHRDFHAWNLLVDRHDLLRVIDFQDALLGPSVYDLVGLLNDRDMDAALGAENHKVLLADFCQKSGVEPTRFYNQYRKVLLQRDLKVAGRFSKLATERGLVSYRLWVPGTLRRIGKTLFQIISADVSTASYQRLLEVLELELDDIRLGYQVPIVE